VLFRVVSDSVSDLDKWNQALRIEALTRGVAVLGETVVDGKTALKFTILNPCLKISDFDVLVTKIEDLAAELAK
jgi:diaminobutyrate-2-oxoglutarate transaminase